MKGVLGTLDNLICMLPPIEFHLPNRSFLSYVQQIISKKNRWDSLQLFRADYRGTGEIQTTVGEKNASTRQIFLKK